MIRTCLWIPVEVMARGPPGPVAGQRFPHELEEWRHYESVTPLFATSTGFSGCLWRPWRSRQKVLPVVLELENSLILTSAAGRHTCRNSGRHTDYHLDKNY